MTNTPVPARPAATLLIVRNTPTGLEVFLVVRNRAVSFASGALVFPGGKVDQQDRDLIGSDLTEGFDTLEPFEAACRIAALREAYEEAGILLAHRQDGSRLSGDVLAAHEAERERIANCDMPFADFLRAHGLKLSAAAMAPVARWITPPESPRRFDTMFYLAAAPEDQIAAHDGGESVHSLWIRPQQALDEGEAGKWFIIVPTQFTLEWLAQFRTVEEAMAATRNRAIPPIHGSVEVRDGIEMFCIPEEACYPRSSIPTSQIKRGF